MSIQCELNDLAREYLKDLRIGSLVPFKTNDGPYEVELFKDKPKTLKQRVAGVSANVPFVELKDDGALVRQLVGYVTSARMALDPKCFNFYFSILLNSALVAAHSKVGDLAFRKITIADKCFVDLHTAAAYEFIMIVEPKTFKEE